MHPRSYPMSFWSFSFFTSVWGVGLTGMFWFGVFTAMVGVGFIVAMLVYFWFKGWLVDGEEKN